MKNIKRIIFFSGVLLIINAVSAFGADFYDDISNVKKYNPDGWKYEFVKNYLVSLTYLNQNAHRRQDSPSLNPDAPQDTEIIGILMDNLILDNVNLRIARNLLKRYYTPQNGLILKTADLFIKVCNEQIEFNNRERAHFAELYDMQIDGDLTGFDNDVFLKRNQSLAEERKASLKKLLEASMLIGKVLVSDEADSFGELVMLGITDEEREKLLDKLDKFQGEEFEGVVRDGQTFLQGSVAAIREVLEDVSWDTLDE